MLSNDESDESEDTWVAFSVTFDIEANAEPSAADKMTLKASTATELGVEESAFTDFDVTHEVSIHGNKSQCHAMTSFRHMQNTAARLLSDRFRVTGNDDHYWTRLIFGPLLLI